MAYLVPPSVVVAARRLERDLPELRAGLEEDPAFAQEHAVVLHAARPPRQQHHALPRVRAQLEGDAGEVGDGHRSEGTTHVAEAVERDALDGGGGGRGRWAAATAGVGGDRRLPDGQRDPVVDDRVNAPNER